MNIVFFKLIGMDYKAPIYMESTKCYSFKDYYLVVVIISKINFDLVTVFMKFVIIRLEAHHTNLIS